MSKHNYEIVEVYKSGPYIHIHVKTATGIHGYGISRHAYRDKYNEQKGMGIALGRALKAANKKENGKAINEPFMG